MNRHARRVEAKVNKDTLRQNNKDFERVVGILSELSRFDVLIVRLMTKIDDLAIYGDPHSLIPKYGERLGVIFNDLMKFANHNEVEVSQDKAKQVRVRLSNLNDIAALKDEALRSDDLAKEYHVTA